MSTKRTKTTGIEPYIIECMCLRLAEKEALSYLKDKGFKIGRTEFYSLKKEIQDSTHERLNLIASTEFLEQHITRLDNLNTVLNELWLNYHKENNPTKKCNILMQIAEMQTYLSSYYDSTQYVMQQSAIIKKKRKEQLEEKQE